MNCSVHVFGNFSSGYTQFPDDYSKVMFQKFRSLSSSQSKLIIHRDRDLMYYGYIRELSIKNQYVGFCVLVNGIMFTRPDMLLHLFENIITDLVVRGEILQFNDNGDIISQVTDLKDKREELKRVEFLLKNEIGQIENYTQKLPPLNYTVSKDSTKAFSLRDSYQTVAHASINYGFIVLSNSNGDTESLKNYSNILRKLNEERDELKTQNSALKNKQRNTVWVGILTVLVAILTVILYFKVLNPSEVTNYRTGEFIYYGPLKNKQPDGTGVAIYPDDDKDGRKYYIGNFNDGERQDKNAMLFYQNGDYFYGSMIGDRWDEGMYYSTSNDAHFVGTFRNNEPYNGTWYNHVKWNRVKDGYLVDIN